MGAIKSRFRKVNNVSESVNYYSFPWGINSPNVTTPPENYCQFYDNGQVMNIGQMHNSHPYLIPSFQQQPYFSQNGSSLGSQFFHHTNLTPDQYHHLNDFTQYNYEGQLSQVPLSYNSANFIQDSAPFYYNPDIQELYFPPDQLIPAQQQAIGEYNFPSQTMYPSDQFVNSASKTIYPAHHASNLFQQTYKIADQQYNPQHYGKTLTYQAAQHFNPSGNLINNNTKIEYDSFTSLSRLSDGYGGFH